MIISMQFIEMKSNSKYEHVSKVYNKMISSIMISIRAPPEI